MTLTLAEIQERDNRAALATGRLRNIGEARGVQSLLVEDVQSNVAGRVNAGTYEERWLLKCMTADLPELPVPQQALRVDDAMYIVETVQDIEGMLDLRLVVRRA
jgi:hypothetical protein